MKTQNLKHKINVIGDKGGWTLGRAGGISKVLVYYLGSGSTDVCFYSLYSKLM